MVLALRPSYEQKGQDYPVGSCAGPSNAISKRFWTDGNQCPERGASDYSSLPSNAAEEAYSILTGRGGFSGIVWMTASTPRREKNPRRASRDRHSRGVHGIGTELARHLKPLRIVIDAHHRQP